MSSRPQWKCLAALVALLCVPFGFAQTLTAQVTKNASDTPHTDAPAETVNWFRSAAIPLKTTNPKASLDDMTPLQAIVGNARIVAMGEATHGTREFFQMKHRMLEFLVEKMGFTVFGIEANWPESLAVNDYVLNGKGDPAVALAGLYVWPWNTAEVLDMIRWMRRYNEDPAHTNKLQFLGFDMQIAHVAVANVDEYLQSVDPQRYRAASEALVPLADEAREREYAHKPRELQRQTAQAIKALLDLFDQRKLNYVAASSEQDWELARHNLEIVMQAEKLYSSNSLGVRDRYMAENVKWILDHQPPGTKIMLWAHNGHVWTADIPRREPMGRVLRGMYGKEMVVCGFAFNQGSFRAYSQVRAGVGGLSTFLVGPAPPDTWDSALAATAIPLFAVDLRSAPVGIAGQWFQTPHRMRTIGAVYDEFASVWSFTPVDSKNFDVIFFVNQTSASQENPQPPRQMETDFGKG